ncbi:MAG: cytochrome c [Alphaproteobacteria bacterium]
MNDRGWRLWGGIAVAVLLTVGVVLGIVVIPIVQGSAVGIDPLTAICRAIGIAPGSPARPTPPSESPPHPVTRVAWTDATLGELYQAQRQDGAALAEERCIACHTVEGNTPDPTIPRNNGQSRFAIYKQLHDYKSGARVSDVMSPLVADLSDKQIADLAAFYGALIRGAIDPERAFPPYVGLDIETLVTKGDVARGVPPCISCHGIGAAGPIETPTITGQYAQYLEAQLTAFSNGGRHNDIYHRMRSIASRLTPAEIKMLAIYYSGH